MESRHFATEQRNISSIYFVMSCPKCQDYRFLKTRSGTGFMNSVHVPPILCFASSARTKNRTVMAGFIWFIWFDRASCMEVKILRKAMVCSILPESCTLIINHSKYLCQSVSATEPEILVQIVIVKYLLMSRTNILSMSQSYCHRTINLWNNRPRNLKNASNCGETFNS